MLLLVSWKKYVLSQKKGLQKILEPFPANYLKKTVSKSYLHIGIFENVIW